MHPECKQVRDEEVDAFVSRQTWDLVPTSLGLPVVSYCWIFTVKYRLDGILDRYKARLIAKGFTQNYGVDYLHILSTVAHLGSIHVIFSLAVNQ